MKIFHVITLAELGGAQSVVINLANKAAETGNEVFVISGDEGAMWNLLHPKITQIKVPEIQRSISLQKEIAVVRKLKKFYQLHKPDVIHLHSSKIGILGRLAFPRKKIVYTIHGFDSIRVAYRKFLPIEKLLKNKAKYIVGVSNYDKDNLKIEGIHKNVYTIYNGIADHTKNASPKPLSENIKNQLKDLKDNSFIIMCIARLSAPKRFDLFADIATTFLNKKEIKFVWIGNQTEPENIPANVVCLGEVSDAHQCLSYTDLFILPSDFEGLPISILEALAYAKPVLASNVGGIKEVLDGTNGFVSENKTEDFQKKIEKFINKEYDYQKFSSNARKTFEEKFTIDDMYNNYQKLYQQIYKENKK